MALLNPPSFLQNRDDHTAQQDRLMLGGLVASSGIGKIGDLKVSAQPAPNMSVQVAAGRCFIIGTQNTHQGVYHCYNNGPVTVNIAAASATLPRKDIIVAQVRDEFYSGVENDWQIVAITGVPASAPAEPALPANSLKLATIDVAANASTITNANIVASVLPATSALALASETQQQLALLDNPPFTQIRYRGQSDVPMNTSWRDFTAWDDAEIDTEGMWNPADPTYLTVKTPGWYEATTMMTFTVSATGRRGIAFRKNDVDLYRVAVACFPPEDALSLEGSRYINLNAGDKVSVICYMDTAPLSVVYYGGEENPLFSLRWIRPI